ncbi:MAG: hypothetical protein HYZ62_02055 [Candidatus Andersenbacteria bacterium]|nr:hypothetical protein [Candidatus Andersenbacteria bacterium]
MKAVSRDQMGEVLAAVAAETNWADVDGDRLQSSFIALPPAVRRQRLTAFFRNGCELTMVGSPIFTIDRSQPFNPADVFGKGWTMWKGPADGTGLDGEEEWDERSRALPQFDPAKVVLEHCLKEGENSIKGEEKLKRLRAEFTALIRLDPQLGYALVQEPRQRTLEWMRINLDLTWIDLPGGVLRSPDGRRFFLYVYFDDERWECSCFWLEFGWRRQHRSGLLASSDLKA